MAEDVERVLSDLEVRLRELEAELAGDAPTPAPGPAPAGSASADALDAFGESLRRAAADLVSAYDRALADARGVPPGDALLFRDEVAVDVEVDLDGLCTLAAALGGIPGVSSVALRAYAGGHAALDLVLDGGVPLVTELRRALDVPLAVVEARHGRLSLALGR